MNPTLYRGEALDSLSRYLQDIGRHDLLTADEEVVLAQAIEAGAWARGRLAHAGDPVERMRLERQIRAADGARGRFIESNLRLVVANARRYTNGSVDLLDLIQEGNLGLMRAVDKYDWRKGFKFSTYATWWIRQAMQRALDRHHLIRIPTRLSEQAAAVTTAVAELSADLGRAPSNHEVAEFTGVDVSKIDEARQAIVSLDSPVGEDGAEVGDFVADDSADPEQLVEAGIVEQAVRDSLESLDPIQRQVLVLRLGLEDGRPRPMAEIERAVGLSAHQIRMVADQALGTLRERLRRVEEMVAA